MAVRARDSVSGAYRLLEREVLRFIDAITVIWRVMW